MLKWERQYTYPVSELESMRRPPRRHQHLRRHRHYTIHSVFSNDLLYTHCVRTFGPRTLRSAEGRRPRRHQQQ